MLRVLINFVSDLINIIEVDRWYREIVLGAMVLVLRPCGSILLLFYETDIRPLSSILILMLECILEFALPWHRPQLLFFERQNLSLCLVKLVGKLSQIFVVLLFSLKLLKVCWLALALALMRLRLPLLLVR